MSPVLVPAATTRAVGGLVASADQLASQAGVTVLDLGGTAVDAAIAANAVLAVTGPHLCGMGGDLFALVCPSVGPPLALAASGRAGSGADPARLRAEGHRVMPFRDDVRAATVPGCVDGWVALHERFGRLPLADVLAPAVHLARRGFAASPLLAAAAPLLAGVPGARDLAQAAPYPAGTRIRRPGVADVLQRVATEGRHGFYAGPVGADLLEAGGGEYAPDDLARPQAEWVEPLALDAWGVRVWTVPPPSQGYLTLAGVALAASLPLPDDPDDAAWAHLLAEAARAAARDRLVVLHEHADGRGLLHADRLTVAHATVDPERAGGGPVPADPGDTTAIVAVDDDGLGVSLIQSNASGFGCHVAIGATGVLLHNRGIGFTLEPGHPAEYGPGKRPPHTLSPAVTTSAGAWSVLLGTMGGDSQPQILLQVLARLLRAEQSPATAVASARWRWASPADGGFDTWVDPSAAVLQVEGHAPARWAEGLRARGHRVEPRPPFDTAFGHAQVIVRTPHGAAGAADPRARVGAALGR